MLRRINNWRVLERFWQIFALQLVTLGLSAGALAHESSPLIVKLTVNQERYIELTTTIELEKTLLEWKTIGGDAHSEVYDELYQQLSALPSDVLVERFRAAHFSGSAILQLIGERGREIPLTLESASVTSGTPSDTMSDPGNTNGRSATITFAASLLDSESGVRVKAISDNSAMIVSVAVHAENTNAVVNQPHYLQPGEPSDYLMLLGDSDAQTKRVFLQFLTTGFSHIIPKGLDHVLFIVALVLLAPGWKILTLQVSLFTLAHSVTLALGILDIVNVPALVVEPMIAASIIYLCLENLRRTDRPRFRLLVIVLFGLLHGLGFASVLTSVGLQTGSFMLALSAFNLGIEVAQLIIVLSCSVLLSAIQKYQPIGASSATALASLALGVGGVYLLIERIPM